MASTSPLQKFLYCEIKRIKIEYYKEFNDENITQEYMLVWIANNAQMFRNLWELSKCKECKNYNECGWSALSACNYFIE